MKKRLEERASLVGSSGLLADYKNKMYKIDLIIFIVK